MNTIALVCFYAGFHWVAREWMDRTVVGGTLKNFLQTWKTDSFLHLILCGATVVVWGMVSIYVLAMSLTALGF